MCNYLYFNSSTYGLVLFSIHYNIFLSILFLSFKHLFFQDTLDLFEHLETEVKKYITYSISVIHTMTDKNLWNEAIYKIDSFFF